jgi:hypothetical protein
MNLPLLMSFLLLNGPFTIGEVSELESVNLGLESSNLGATPFTQFEVQISALTIHIASPQVGAEAIGVGGNWSYFSNTGSTHRLTAQLMSEDGSVPQNYSPGLSLYVTFAITQGVGIPIPSLLLDATQKNVMTDITQNSPVGGTGTITYLFKLTSNILQHTVETRSVRLTLLDQ